MKRRFVFARRRTKHSVVPLYLGQGSKKFAIPEGDIFRKTLTARMHSKLPLRMPLCGSCFLKKLKLLIRNAESKKTLIDAEKRRYLIWG